jgi:ElaB/YqjD/DUF883 family membrane-anchored ribosome-binding protein
MSYANQFVISKKEKSKKEMASHVKDDIVELLESTLRQLGRNIQQSVTVQWQIFDTIKDMYGQGQQSTVQLKEIRDKLQSFLKKIEQQQEDFRDFLLTCR